MQLLPRARLFTPRFDDALLRLARLAAEDDESLMRTARERLDETRPRCPLTESP